jgi:3-methylfumaryl-CoA hydratase
MALDLDALRGWTGRRETDHDRIQPRQARLLAATLGSASDGLQTGAPLPPLWHWVYFLQGLPPEALGRDGHPARGGFLPPVPLSNRMWAGGRVHWHRPLPLGSAAEKTSTVQDIAHKQGRSGDLVFVTVRHELHAEGALCVAEEQDIVYRNPSPAGAAPPAAAPAAAMPDPAHEEAWTPDSTELFRYSALTFNGHRIHYDADYCREVEGYPGLVVHGPLIATRLAGLVARVLGRPLQRFAYRGQRPSFAGQALRLCVAAQADGCRVWAAQADGAVAFDATAG